MSEDEIRNRAEALIKRLPGIPRSAVTLPIEATDVQRTQLAHVLIQLQRLVERYEGLSFMRRHEAVVPGDIRRQISAICASNFGRSQS